MGIGVAYRKQALESVGGFNPQLQVFEYLDLSLRSKGFKVVKNPNLTVLHLEPESRFTLSGFLQRKEEYGYWYHSLFSIYPSGVGLAGFPVKLAAFLGMVFLLAIFPSVQLFLAFAAIFVVWNVWWYHLLRRGTPIWFAAGKFDRWQRKLLAFLVAIAVRNLGDLASDFGKLRGMINGPSLRMAKGIQVHSSD